MFQVDPEGSQQIFESMPVEPQMKEIIGSNNVPIKYYVYELED